MNEDQADRMIELLENIGGYDLELDEQEDKLIIEMQKCSQRLFAVIIFSWAITLTLMVALVHFW